MDIAQKLETVAKNQQKVYESGKLSVCPPIDESGTIVTCYPLEGYPLTVTTEASATEITRCGKNLFDFTQTAYEVTHTASSGASTTRWGFAISLPAGTYTLHADRKATTNDWYLYGAINKADGTFKEACSLHVGAANYRLTKTIDRGDTIYIFHGYASPSQSQVKALFEAFDIQIEVGTTATAFEPYSAETFTPGETILGKPGINTIYADAGNITVTGKADPSAIIESLTNAIISYGGNV